MFLECESGGKIMTTYNLVVLRFDDNGEPEVLITFISIDIGLYPFRLPEPEMLPNFIFR